jgi:hypothetical protein
MLLEKENEIVKAIGPFEQAKTNLERFAWNYMIVYTVSTIVKAYEFIDEGDADKLQLTKITADATLKGIFQLILDKNNQVWD